MIHLLENIDGQRSIAELQKIMLEEYEIPVETTLNVLTSLESARLITEVSDALELLDSIQKERFTRQINYIAEFSESEFAGVEAQKKLSDSHVCVFGCGAVGGNIAYQLAMAGVGHFTLYDYDSVESSDLSRHIYFKESNIGMKKVEALREAIYQLDSSIDVEVVPSAMKPDTDIEPLISRCNFVVNTMDEPYIGYTSAKISRLCVKHRIAHFVAGGFDAHLASTGELIIPYVTPCVECYADHFKEVLKGWKPKKHPVQERYNEIGGLASMSLFSSSYACLEILKYLTGIMEMEESFKVRGEFLFHDMSLTYLNVKRNPNCPVCGGAHANEAEA